MNKGLTWLWPHDMRELAANVLEIADEGFHASGILKRPSGRLCRQVYQETSIRQLTKKPRIYGAFSFTKDS